MSEDFFVKILYERAFLTKLYRLQKQTKAKQNKPVLVSQVLVVVVISLQKQTNKQPKQARIRRYFARDYQDTKSGCKFLTSKAVHSLFKC